MLKKGEKRQEKSKWYWKQAVVKMGIKMFFSRVPDFIKRRPRIGKLGRPLLRCHNPCNLTLHTIDAKRGGSAQFLLKSMGREEKGSWSFFGQQIDSSAWSLEQAHRNEYDLYVLLKYQHWFAWNLCGTFIHSFLCACSGNPLHTHFSQHKGNRAVRNIKLSMYTFLWDAFLNDLK